MDTENIFDNSDVTMVSVKLKKMVADYFLILQELELDLLPSPYLLIAKMLEFSLPLQSSVLMLCRTIFDLAGLLSPPISRSATMAGLPDPEMQKRRMRRMMKGPWMLHPLLLGEASARKSPRGVI